MSGVIDKDIQAVYNRLKDRYLLTLTTTAALDDGFNIDCPVIVGKTHAHIMWLYRDSGMFFLDVMDCDKTMGTHWHPLDVDDAANDVVGFMEGGLDYDLIPFGQM